MPIARVRSRRRIFRHSSAARPRLLRTLLLLVLAIGGTGGLVMTGLSTNLFGRAPPPPSHLTAAAGGVAVIDGETLLLDGRVVRLLGVDAPDRGDRCASHQDCGGAAAAALAGLVRDRRVECALTGHDSAGRPFADCKADGTDLSHAIVASGWARARPGVPDLADLELRARQQRTGLWAGTTAD